MYIVSAAALPPQWATLLMLAAALPFGLMIVGQLKKLLLLGILLETSFAVDINLFYQEAVRVRGALSGISLSVTTVCLGILYLLWLADIFTRKTTPPRDLLRASLPLGLYVVCAWLSWVGAADRFISLSELFIISQTFLLYVYIVGTVRSQDEILACFSTLLWSVILHAGVLIFAALTQQDFSFFVFSTQSHDNIGAHETFRSGGLLGSPNHAASYFSLLLAPALSLLCLRPRWRQQWLAIAALGLGGIALLLTFSRGGWLAASLSLLGLCLMAIARGWLSVKVLCLVGLLGLGIGLPFSEQLVLRFFGDDGGSAQSRVPLMKLAFQMVAANPLFGVGANNFSVVMQNYMTRDLMSEWIFTVHNKYLLVWAETGTLALIAFVSFLVSTLRRGWRASQRTTRLAPLALGIVFAIVGQSTHMFVDIFHSRQQIQLLWLVAALLTCISLLHRESRWHPSQV